MRRDFVGVYIWNIIKQPLVLHLKVGEFTLTDFHTRKWIDGSPVHQKKLGFRHGIYWGPQRISPQAMVKLLVHFDTWRMMSAECSSWLFGIIGGGVIRIRWRFRNPAISTWNVWNPVNKVFFLAISTGERRISERSTVSDSGNEYGMKEVVIFTWEHGLDWAKPPIAQLLANSLTVQTRRNKKTTLHLWQWPTILQYNTNQVFQGIGYRFSKHQTV